MYGYHFLLDTGYTRYGNLKPEVGSVFTVDSNEIGKGLHGSRTIIQAAMFAHGYTLEYCAFDPFITERGHQFASARRETVWIIQPQNIRKLFGLLSVRAYGDLLELYQRTRNPVAEPLIALAPRDRSTIQAFGPLANFARAIVNGDTRRTVFSQFAYALYNVRENVQDGFTGIADMLAASVFNAIPDEPRGVLMDENTRYGWTLNRRGGRDYVPLSASPMIFCAALEAMDAAAMMEGRRGTSAIIYDSLAQTLVLQYQTFTTP